MFWLSMLSLLSRSFSSGSLKIAHQSPRIFSSAGCATVQVPASAGAGLAALGVVAFAAGGASLNAGGGWIAGGWYLGAQPVRATHVGTRQESASVHFFISGSSFRVRRHG